MQRQKQRQNSVDTEQNFLFKEKTNTIAASRRLVKKLVAIGFSHACRHRLKLDESLFIDRQCEDITVKVLNPFAAEMEDSTTARQVSMWLKKIFEYIEKGFLSNIVLAFYSEKGKPETTIFEMFKFIVKDSALQLQMKDDNDPIKFEKTDEFNLKKSVTKMLMSMTAKMRAMPKMPKKYYVTMRLTTSDEFQKCDKTDEDIYCDGFTPEKEPVSMFTAENVFTEEVHSTFHKFRVRCLRTRNFPGTAAHQKDMEVCAALEERAKKRKREQ